MNSCAKQQICFGGSDVYFNERHTTSVSVTLRTTCIGLFGLCLRSLRRRLDGTSSLDGGRFELNSPAVCSLQERPFALFRRFAAQWASDGRSSHRSGTRKCFPSTQGPNDTESAISDQRLRQLPPRAEG